MEIRFNMTGERRRELVEAIAGIEGWLPVYKKAPTFAYVVHNYTIGKNGELSFDGRVDTSDARDLLAALAERGFVSEDTLEDAVSDVPTDESAPDGLSCGGDNGALPAAIAGSGDDSGRLVIHMPLAGFTAASTANLEKMIAAKAWIIQKMVGADELPIKRDGEYMGFPWFRPDASAVEIDAYSRLVAGICETAKQKQRVTATERRPEEGDNEKFKARCFLLSLGFIGSEYAQARKILLAPMSGSGSFKSGNRKSDAPAPPAMPDADDGLAEALADAEFIHRLHASDEDTDADLAEALADAELIHRINTSFEDDGGSVESGRGYDRLVRGGLCCVPPTDGNYASYLREATDAQLHEAIARMEAAPKGNQGRIAVCRRELRKRGATVC
jgi:hypothetical protein